MRTSQPPPGAGPPPPDLPAVPRRPSAGQRFRCLGSQQHHRDAAIALADQTVPLLKDAMDWAHEADQGRGSGVYEGRLGAGFSQAHGAERALALGIALSFIRCPLR
jgi:hypothetical protein